MGKPKTLLFPMQEKIIKQLGENIKLARLRRYYSMAQVSERAGISRSTLSKLESGNPGVTLDTLVKVMFILGLQDEVASIAALDTMGRNIQDARLLNNALKTSKSHEKNK